MQFMGPFPRYLCLPALLSLPLDQAEKAQLEGFLDISGDVRLQELLVLYYLQSVPPPPSPLPPRAGGPPELLTHLQYP